MAVQGFILLLVLDFEQHVSYKGTPSFGLVNEHEFLSDEHAKIPEPSGRARFARIRNYLIDRDLGIALVPFYAT